MMKRKLILTGAALSLAVAMTGCGGKPVINQQPSSQAQLISMEAGGSVKGSKYCCGGCSNFSDDPE